MSLAERGTTMAHKNTHPASGTTRGTEDSPSAATTLMGPDTFGQVASFLDASALNGAALTCRDWYRWVGDSETNVHGTNAYGVLSLNLGLPLPPDSNGPARWPAPSTFPYSHSGPFPGTGTPGGSWQSHVQGFVPPPPHSRRTVEARRIAGTAARRFSPQKETQSTGALRQRQFDRVKVLHTAQRIGRPLV
jgi:hypothetical protein